MDRLFLQKRRQEDRNKADDEKRAQQDPKPIMGGNVYEQVFHKEKSPALPDLGLSFP
jgi:hypothetical protein